MPSQKSIPISELIPTANSELLRLDFKRSALQIYCAEFRKFSDYYSNEKIQDYTATTGREYFQSIYGVNIASPRLQLTKSQSATRRAIRLLDDIFQFGYALRYCHRSYTVNPEYDILLESYLMKCRKKHEKQTQNKAVLVAAAGGRDCAHKSGRSAASLCGGFPRHAGDSRSRHTGNR